MHLFLQLGAPFLGLEHSSDFILVLGTGKMVLQLRALAVLAEDSGSVPRTYTAVHTWF
jgi:hypothetical protein